MGRLCTICSHSSRNAIDEALARGTPYRSVAQQFAASPDAVNRHKAHVPERLAKARDAKEVVEADRLLDKLTRLEERVERLLSKAETTGQLGPAASFVRELRELLRLFGEISGELQAAKVQVNINEQPKESDLFRMLALLYCHEPMVFLENLRREVLGNSRAGEYPEALALLPPAIETTAVHEIGQGEAQ